MSGWIRNVENVTTGDVVKKDQVLASFFAPDAQLETAQQSYYDGLEMLYRAASAQPQVPSHDSRSAVEEIERLADGLRSLGVSNSQIRQLAKRRELVHDIRVESPVDGVVLKRGVTPGLRFDRGFEFYRIADLNRVWILADVYRDQLPFIRRGASARITTAEESHALSATVSPSEPIFDEATLTLKVRLEAANPQPGAQARHVRRRGVPVRSPAGARRAGGCDRGLRAAQDGVRRPRQRVLRAAAGRDGLAHRRRRRGDERAGGRRADRDLGHLLRRFREPHEGEAMIDRIIDFSVRNKFLVLLLVGAAALAGAHALRNVPLDALPDLGDTQVIVYSRWDRSPDVIEAQVTYPIVTAMLGAPHVRAVRGVSDFGYSYVYVIFEDGTDIYWARTRTHGVPLGRACRGCRPISRTELGPDATGLGWVFQYALVDRSGKHSLADLRSYQDWYLRSYLKAVPGVSEVASLGGFGRQYQVNVDPNRLRNYGLSIQRVVEAVRGGNVETGGRLIEFGGTEYMVRGRGYAKSIADFESIVVSASESGTPIRIRDIGHVTVGPDLRRGIADLDGTGEVVSGIVVMRQGENAVDVIDRVKERIRQIEPGMPPGMEIVPIYDRSALIRRAIDNVSETLVEVVAHRRPGRAAVPVAPAECAHPAHHHSGCRARGVHPVPRDGDHGEHHVARRHRDRDGRTGGRGDRRRRADAQEARGGAARADRPATIARSSSRRSRRWRRRASSRCS